VCVCVSLLLTAKLGEGIEVAELHDVGCLIALEVRVVGVLEKELPMLDVLDRLGRSGVEPECVCTYAHTL